MLRVLAMALAILALITSTLSFSPSNAQPLTPGITLIGKGVISGSALDTSGLTGNICQASALANCVPKAIFGGFGSDITYTGHDNVFIAAPDRGPFDGLTDVPYLDRFYFLHITTDLGTPFPNIRTVLLDTRFLKNQGGENFVGAAGAFGDPSDSIRRVSASARTERFTFQMNMGHISLNSTGKGTLLDASKSHQSFSFPTRAQIQMPSCLPMPPDARRIAAWRDWQSVQTAEHCSE